MFEKIKGFENYYKTSFLKNYKRQISEEKKLFKKKKKSSWKKKKKTVFEKNYKKSIKKQFYGKIFFCFSCRVSEPQNKCPFHN